MTLGTTSGTYLFAPPVSNLVLEAFSRCLIRGTAITRRHMYEATQSINYVLTDWSNRGVNLWEVDLQTLAITAGTPTYNLPVTTVTVLDVYRTVVDGGGAGQNIDNIMLPMSRTQYAMIPNKDEQGTPTLFWFNRQTTPQLTFWLVPNEGTPDFEISYYRLKRVMDANPVNGQIPEVPFWFSEALVSDLAAAIAEKFAPALWKDKVNKARDAWNRAISIDQENAPMEVRPLLNNYWPS